MVDAPESDWGYKTKTVDDGTTIKPPEVFHIVSKPSFLFPEDSSYGLKTDEAPTEKVKEIEESKMEDKKDMR